MAIREAYEKRARHVVADWIYSGESGSGMGMEILIKRITDEFCPPVMETEHNAKDVMQSEPVRYCPVCGGEGGSGPGGLHILTCGGDWD